MFYKYYIIKNIVTQFSFKYFKSLRTLLLSQRKINPKYTNNINNTKYIFYWFQTSIYTILSL